MLVEQLVDRRVVDAINREVDDAVAAAVPGMQTMNPMIQAFFGPVTKHVSALAAESPTFANEVMVHPTYLAVCDAVLLPLCSRYQLNLGHLIVRGPGATAQLAHRDEDVWPHFPRPHPDIQLASMLALVDFRAEERRHPRRAGEPSLGARPCPRTPRDRRRGHAGRTAR